MQKHINLLACISLICLVATGISCMKKQEIQVAATSNDIASDTSTGKTQNKDTAKEKAELCIDGNCPCGDGFCAKNSVCIKDMCFCGAFLNKGFIDENAIVSNLYGEFECARYVSDEQCTIYRVEYNFVCTRNEGCKTGDGREFPFFEPKKSYLSKDMYVTNESFEFIYDDEHPILLRDTYKTVAYDYEKFTYGLDNYTFYGDDYYPYNISKERVEKLKNDSSNFIPYKDLLKEHRLNNCGKPLPENLKIRPDVSSSLADFKLDRYYLSVEDFEVPSDLECDLRKSCNDSVVTPEHLNEYVCDIGTKYFKKPCETTERNRAIGLRCIQPEGCTCGNTHCPEHSLCKDGTCTYDIFYENRSCPNDGWDADKSDIENYMKTVKHCSCEEDTKYNLYCYNECWFHTDVDDDEQCKEQCGYDEDREPGIDCYEKCYWDDYDSTMTKTDPCKK